MSALNVPREISSISRNFSNRAGERHFRAVHAASLHPNDFDGNLHYRDGTGYNRQPDGNFELFKSILERQRSYQSRPQLFAAISLYIVLSLSM